MAEKTLSQFADEHYEWIESVGWAGVRTPLESLGRIGSEIGELVNECRGDKLGDGFADEISDVILSCITFIKEVQFEDMFSSRDPATIAEATFNGTVYPQSRVSGFSTMLEAVSYGYNVLGDVIREYDRNGIKNGNSRRIVIFRAIAIADYFLAVAYKAGININDALTEKMAKNKIKGNRGRKK